MILQASCHCEAVRYTVESHEPYPFNYCYCNVCRKTAGGSGAVINLKGETDSLEVTGREHVRTYHAIIREDGKPDEVSPAERHFCGLCGSALWAWDPRWPDMVHPFASCVDTPLPTPPEYVHLMLESKPDWVPLAPGPKDQQFPRYPSETIAQWHERLGLQVD